MTSRLAPRILVVDDEPQIQRFLGPALEAAGYQPLRAATAAEGLRQAATQAPAAIILDLGLPDADGQSLIPRLRAFSAAPIIVLSARNQVEEKVTALDAGAEDYVEKPFELAELLARLRSALRRGGADTPAAAAAITIGPIGIDLGHRLVRLDGQERPLHLTPREWDLLVALARAGGRVVTHRQLLATVWGPAHVGDGQYLRVYIGQLRQKLGLAARLLKTEPGIGYRLAEGE